MKPKRIKKIRDKLQYNQVHLAQILDVHPITVSKWERGILKPSAWQESLLLEFEIAQKKFKDIGERALTALYFDGINSGLYTLLSAARTDK